MGRSLSIDMAWGLIVPSQRVPEFLRSYDPEYNDDTYWYQKDGDEAWSEHVNENPELKLEYPSRPPWEKRDTPEWEAWSEKHGRIREENDKRKARWIKENIAVDIMTYGHCDWDTEDYLLYVPGTTQHSYWHQLLVKMPLPEPTVWQVERFLMKLEINGFTREELVEAGWVVVASYG